MEESIECRNCQGHGRVQIATSLEVEEGKAPAEWTTCKSCGGSGWILRFIEGGEIQF